MDLILQVRPSTQYDPYNPATSSRSNRDDLAVGFAMFMAIVLLVAIVWQFMVKVNFDEAKRAFQSNPTDPEAKQNLIQAAKSQRDYGRSTNDVVAMLEAQHDREKRQASKKSLATELGTLADLRSKGVLTDDEFELAKKKLLT